MEYVINPWRFIRFLQPNLSLQMSVTESHVTSTLLIFRSEEGGAALKFGLFCRALRGVTFAELGILAINIRWGQDGKSGRNLNKTICCLRLI